MKEFLIKMLATLGLELPAEKKADFERLADEAEKLGKPAPAPAPLGGNDPQAVLIKAAVAEATSDLTKQVAALSDALAKERSDREAAQKALSDKAAEDHKTKIQAKIDEAIKAGRLEPKNEEMIATYRSLLEKDYDAGSKVLDAMPAQKTQQETKPPTTTTQTPAAKPNGNELLANASAAFAETMKN